MATLKFSANSYLDMATIDTYQMKSVTNNDGIVGTGVQATIQELP